MPLPLVFHRTFDVVAIYRLHEPLPIAVAWPSGEQKIRTTGLPKRELEMAGPGNFVATLEFRSAAHAEHVLANGFKVKVPSVWNNFCHRLAREGRATVVWAPCEEIYWLDRTALPPAPAVDAWGTFGPSITLGDVGLGAQCPPPRNLP